MVPSIFFRKQSLSICIVIDHLSNAATPNVFYEKKNFTNEKNSNPYPGINDLSFMSEKHTRTRRNTQ